MHLSRNRGQIPQIAASPCAAAGYGGYEHGDTERGTVPTGASARKPAAGCPSSEAWSGRGNREGRKGALEGLGEWRSRDGAQEGNCRGLGGRGEMDWRRGGCGIRIADWGRRDRGRRGVNWRGGSGGRPEEGQRHVQGRGWRACSARTGRRRTLRSGGSRRTGIPSAAWRALGFDNFLRADADLIRHIHIACASPR
jgi:hypothetical protein